MKTIQISRSMDPADLKRKVAQAQELLSKGNEVALEVTQPGRIGHLAIRADIRTRLSLQFLDDVLGTSFQRHTILSYDANKQIRAVLAP